MLILSGDIHPNPGPLSSNSDSDSSSCQSMTDILSSGLSILHLNIQSLKPKLDLLQAEMQAYDILIFTETWLSSQTSDDELLIPNFQKPFRLDRDDRIGGGVAIYLRDTLFGISRRDLHIPSLEALWIEVRLNNRPYLIGGFYRPPNTGNLYWNFIEESFDKAFNTNINDIIITGDFNSNMLSNNSGKLQNLIQSYGYTQMISEPTHFTEASSSLLDLFIVRNTTNIKTTFVSDPFIPDLIRYHVPIVLILSHKKSSKPSFKRTVWQYDQGNYDEYRNSLCNNDWDFINANINIDLIATNLNEIILKAAKKSIPNKEITVRTGKIPWLYSSVRRLIGQRRRLHKRAKTLNTELAWADFRRKRNQTVSAIRKAKLDHLNKTSETLNNPACNIKTWFKLAKQVINKSTKSDNIPTLYFENTIANSDEEKVELLNNYFCKQSTVNDKDTRLPALNPPNTQINEINITAQDVLDVLKNLNVSKASGPDGINPRLLREGADALSIPLAKLFNLSIKKAIFPTNWKMANVTPVFKKADPSLPCNYRPISLLSCISKVMERCIFKYLFNYLAFNDILTPLQSGFIPGDSTVNQLVSLYDEFCKALDDGKEIRCVFCDISKAFDRVWHAGLLHKLRQIGLSESLVDWFSSYLDSRRQRVVFNSKTSDWKNIDAGVPQGSILGPILFLIYINDIVDDIHSKIRLFADDTSLYLIVDNPNETAERINSDLERINVWSKQWLVDFNPSKTKSLNMTRKLHPTKHPRLHMDNTEITEVEHHKHLGLILSKDGRWHHHIQSITSKAWQRIGLLRQLKFALKRNTLEHIYTCFIRPLLEYADIVWSNCTIEEGNALESVQTEAARIILGVTKLCNITKMYDDLNWERLETRRRHHRLILFYKMKNGLSPNFLSTLIPQQVTESSSYNLRNAQDYHPIFARTSLYRNSFLPSVIRDWNNLPITLKNSETLGIFKSRLSHKQTINAYFTYGDRNSQVLHSRLRLKCSSLNDDLFKRSLVVSPACLCGLPETTYHFFFSCPMYTEQRLAHLTNLPCLPTLSNILHGCQDLSIEDNKKLFELVSKYIHSTKRFVTS